MEKAELDERVEKLHEFLNTEFFQSLPKDERERLAAQEDAMETYSGILAERIDAFQA